MILGLKNMIYNLCLLKIENNENYTCGTINFQKNGNKE